MSQNIKSAVYETEQIRLHYYEAGDSGEPLVMIHAQGVDGLNFKNTFRKLSERYHIYSVDCYGHGGSLHDREKYTIAGCAEPIIEFIQHVVGEKVFLLGHYSGGLIAAYIAAETELCRHLFLEDAPFFSCQGEKRKSTYNYVDLSTVCHQYLAQDAEKDFPLYYFSHQYAWRFFPDKNREKLRAKMIRKAARNRRRHPERDLRVMFWPQSVFKGMNEYDPRFGEAFYDDSFHGGISHDRMLRKIECKASFFKAKTEETDDGILLAALDEEDLRRVTGALAGCAVKRFECGHGIHLEKAKEFTDYLLEVQG